MSNYLDRLIFIMELLIILKDKEILISMIECDFSKLVKFTELLKNNYGFGFEYNINDLKVAGIEQMREAVMNEFDFEGLTVNPDNIQFAWINSSERGISFTNLSESTSTGEKNKNLFNELELLTEITNKIYYYNGVRDEFKQTLENIINN